MSFDFSSLVTDRKQEDVYRTIEIVEKVENKAATQEELDQYNNHSFRGAYTYKDANRVGEAILCLSDMLSSAGFSVNVNPKTDWKPSDWMTGEDVDALLKDVSEIRKHLKQMQSTPPVPEKLKTIQGANDIEKVLRDTERLILSMRFSMPVFAQSIVFSGFAVYASHKTLAPVEEWLRLYTADGLAVFTADGLAVYLKS